MRTSEHSYSDRITIRRRGKKGTWVAHFTHRGQHAKRSLKTSSLPAAKAAAAELEKRMVLGTVRPGLEIPFEEAARRYLEDRGLDGVSEGTLRSYRTEIDYLCAFARNAVLRCPTDLTPALLTEFAKFRVEQPGRRSSVAQNTAAAAYKACLHAKMFMSWLKANKLTSENPLADVRLRKPPQVRPANPRMADAMRMIAAAVESDAQYLAVLAFTGTRITALTRLSPNDVDLAGGFLKLYSDKTRTHYEVPIHPRLRPFLEAAVAAAGSAPVLFARNPRARAAERRPLNKGTVRQRIKALAEALGLNAGRANRGWTPHVFRHAFETHCVNGGVPQVLVDRWMCHLGNGKTSTGYYGPGRDDSKAKMDNLTFPDFPTPNRGGFEAV